MKPLATLLAASLLLSAATASAQTSFHIGGRGGLNQAQLVTHGASNDYPSRTSDASALYAWQAGITLEARRGNFAVQPALLFSQKGSRFSTVNTIVGFAGTDTWKSTGTNRYNWVELPLHVVYTQHGDHGLQLFAGPYVALAVGGHQQGNTTHYSWTGATDDKPIDQKHSYNSLSDGKRVDAGLNFGVGYRQGPLQVQLSYGLGLRNLRDLTQRVDSESGSYDAAYNRVAQLTGTYFFAL
ncbi:MAG TPA: porin family protein [Hymenobacter sp.]|uniref:porin family protein n=1 Tax=Hymenobacter sp. TaxID=1898978 RepID=UPI002D7F5F6E|nr:porin family protein [Hymenobacter sp.]HET9506175.1 porin family protein [Hymenobacter sp.]